LPIDTAVAISSRWSGVKRPRCMSARDRFQFASSSAGQCAMHRQMFDTLVAPKTAASRRSTASKMSFVLPATVAGSAIRIVVILFSSGRLRGRVHMNVAMSAGAFFLPPATGTRAPSAG
jgi:hypothetical protein